ncbi:oligosaccharide flippase family protein [Galbibacter sp. EGI 63066]|uniref:lipopolysaccharide biosynthesis protein n=1 Tax=Galbibacter sp. EGI 63066 TaxID=2993559 RepID=UPI00224899FF|nr:oligosaccharide flippase family protein [Galbibacter sp. EGI 63066]MCX2680675.1 oligosaccharide flippase family protein [Galbibacter sp. EGI 63066]
MTKKLKSLIINFSSYTIINLFNSLTPFIILPLLTKNLSKSDIGIIDLFTTSSLFLTPVIGLCMIQSISKLYFTVSNKSKYLSTLATCLLIIGGITCIGTILILYSTNLIHYPPDKKLLILLIVIYVFETLIIEGYLILKRNEEQIKQFAWLRLSKAVLDIILTFTLLYYYDNYNARIFSLILSSSITVFIILYHIIKAPYFKLLIDKALIQKILIYSSPLILHTFFNNILNYSDRYFINEFLGTSELGKYSVIYQMCMIMSLFINSFSMAWTPYFMKNMAINETTFMTTFFRTYKYYSLLLLIGAILMFFIMPLVYEFYIGKEYLVDKSIYFSLLLGYFFQGLYRFKINILFFKECTFTIAKLSFISASVNLLLNFFLVDKWGLFGAAFATLISYFILFLSLEFILLLMKKRSNHL